MLLDAVIQQLWFESLLAVEPLSQLQVSVVLYSTVPDMSPLLLVHR